MLHSLRSEPVWFAPQRKLGGGWLAFKSSPSPPATPDYVGAAQAQGAANLQTAVATGQLSNPNVNTPYGSQSVSYSPDPTTGNPIPTINQTLAPAQQSLLDSQNSLSQQLANIGSSELPQVASQLSTPIQAQSGQDAANQAYGELTARLDPQWQQNTEQNAAQLANQGISQGSEAYNNAMRTFNQSENDAYSQAQLSAQQLAPQTQAMDITGQSALLNELDALRSGSQVQSPSYQPYTGSQVGQTPVMQATQAQGAANQNIYNQQQSAANANTSGLYGLGGTALTAMMLMSDRRLKSNIVPLARVNGVMWYAYDIAGIRARGVMADEVPHAAIRLPSGYLAVDYGKL